MVAPVVVKPETVSKNASTGSVMAPDIINGSIPTSDSAIHVRPVDIKPSFDTRSWSWSENFIKKTVYFYGDIKGQAEIKEDSIDLEWVDLEEEDIKNLNLPPDQEEALLDFADFLQRKFLEQVD